ncbi:hypothetical protein PoB_003626100 [Plakobranchus ocellatus]|uniref:Uncharacterized protein n=1 Tax=Plakobranchus ocellatus TaxID=259542 RepID=A0AAV4ANK2_9GAST|nr:hypothetical protein PoB_003626100 [Plakobranchus ocellatus]
MSKRDKSLGGSQRDQISRQAFSSHRFQVMQCNRTSLRCNYWFWATTRRRLLSSTRPSVPKLSGIADFVSDPEVSDLVLKLRQATINFGKSKNRTFTSSKRFVIKPITLS